MTDTRVAEFSRFRKKPVVIEAFEYDPEVPGMYQLLESLPGVKVETGRGYEAAYIETLEGTHRAEPGDYIIRGVRGEIYPCKPDIFAKTYDNA